jgi:tetratricopeptide (TPR) repeat protein
MAKYERWFQRDELDEGKLLAAVRLLGFFDRPADPASLRSLCEPPIKGLSEPLAGIGNAGWNITRSRMAEIGLTWPADESGAIDAHPLVRGYFAGQLRAQNGSAWRKGHQRLYTHLCSTVPDQPQAFSEVSVLLRAVVHGCEGGKYRHALESTYRHRILQLPHYYHTDRLGAYGAGLSALRGFFEEPWERPVRALTPSQRAFVVHEAAVHLNGLGRLEEALAPFRVAFSLYSDKLSDFSHAALSARYLSELNMAVGRLNDAISWGQKGLECAEKAGNAFEQMAESSTLARALFRSGQFGESERYFLHAEEFVEHEQVSPYRYWYFFWEFDFCELLLAQGRIAEAWQRASAALQNIHLTGESPIATSQIHLAVGRVLLERGAPEDLAAGAQHIEQAVEGLRKAGHPLYLMDGLLAHAGLRGRQGNVLAAKADLDAAWDIAARGPMRLAMTDILLLRASLFGDQDAYEEARQDIEQWSYGRHRIAAQDR